MSLSAQDQDSTWSEAPVDTGQVEVAEKKEAPLINSINFEILNQLHPDYKHLHHIARQVTGFKPGIRLSEKWVRQTAENLELCGKFSEIHLETSGSAGELNVQIKLTPLYYVKNVIFKNSYPLFRHELEKIMTLKTGSGFTPGLVEEQKPLLKKLFLREGIKLKSIYAQISRESENSDVTVIFQFNKDYWYTLGNFTVKGNSHFSNFKWKYQFQGLRKLNPLPHRKRFIQKEFKTNLNKMKKKYVKDKFYDIYISDSLVYDSLAHRVNTLITVSEGYPYKFMWKGNESFSAFWTLKKQLDFSTGNKRDIGLKKSLNNLVSFYQSRGYLQAKIRYSTRITKGKNPEREVLFTIKEGPLYKVAELKITGNHTMTDEKLSKQVLTEKGKGFNEGVFTEDAAGINALYIQNGYYGTLLDTTIRIEKNHGLPLVYLTIDIKEGARRMVEKISFDNKSALPTGFKNNLKTRTGSPFVLNNVREDKINLNAVLSESGYPHSEINLHTGYNSDSSLVQLNFSLDSGSRVYMGDVYYSGNFKTRSSVLDREIMNAKGSPLSLIKVLESQRRVQNLPLFNSVQFKPIGLKEKFDTVTVHLSLEEKPARYFALRGGYQSDLGVVGGAKLGNINLLGLNKHTWLGGTLHHTSGRFWIQDELGWKTEAGLLEPRLFGTRISASTIAAFERENEAGQDFYTDITSGTVGFTRTYWERLTLGTAFEYELRKATGTSNSLGLRSNLITRPSLTYDTRDNFIRPRAGTFSNYIMEISQALDDLPGDEADDDFLAHHLVGKRFYSPFTRLTLAVIGRWSMVSDSSLPDDQKLYLGGTSDVRGYSENRLAPEGGNLAVSWSLESRIDIGWNFEMALFYDAGRLSTVDNHFEADEYSFWNYEKSVGTGIRYITPIGPVGLLYGHKIDPSRYGAWHFTLGYTF